MRGLAARGPGHTSLPLREEGPHIVDMKFEVTVLPAAGLERAKASAAGGRHMAEVKHVVV